ncbi:sulfatase-like hydrolase/transferase [Sunxiuqinia sp. A32]|uniref:sulfatase-like hydrolase/transferase n=1 Tax=Sunxiuqinia sp. A32 TaxID=3461496 RepID=UPI00404681A7
MTKSTSILLLLLLFTTPLLSKEKPNILLVFIDDMGYGDLACYGNNEVKTPNIDKLASEGIQFNQFYSNAPICSPSRVAITTGQYPSRWAINTIVASREKNRERGVSDCLSLKAPTIARELSANGYYTAHIGKWHMGGGRDIGDVPLITEYGFDESVTQFEGLGERYLATYETLDLGGDSTRNLEKWSAALGRGEIHWENRYMITGKFVDRAIQAIENAQKADKPFYINLWPDDVHTPNEPSPTNRRDGSKHAFFNGVVNELDVELGRIFDYIKNNKELAENTLVIVTSDNGPEKGIGSAGNLRGHKFALYEGGIREPFIVWYPPKIKANKQGTINTESVIVAMDLPPTILSIAGINYDEIKFDGIDVSPILLGEKSAIREQPVMWRRPTDHDIKNGVDFPDMAIRQGDFKLLINFDGTGVELYNIKNDEAETTNLATKYPKIVNELKEKVFEWHVKAIPANK